MNCVKRKEAELQGNIISQTKKDDFKSFWQNKIEKLRTVELKYERVRLDLPYRAFDAYEITYNTYAAGIIDGSFLYPAHAGGAILLSTLAGIIFFRDKLTKRQMLSFVLGIVAIVLMNW